jgi:hypothetical protein
MWHRSVSRSVPLRSSVGCFSPSLLVIDEASRVADDLFRAVRPMLAVSKRRLVALSTPFGQQGWFWSEWHGDGPWKRIKVIWPDCPRISAGFVADEERAMGKPWIRQEYECLFTALEGLVYPNFEQTATDVFNPIGKPRGGIDRGWRNPFARPLSETGQEDRDETVAGRSLRTTTISSCKMSTVITSTRIIGDDRRGEGGTGGTQTEGHQWDSAIRSDRETRSRCRALIRR